MLTINLRESEFAVKSTVQPLVFTLFALLNAKIQDFQLTSLPSFWERAVIMANYRST